MRERKGKEGESEGGERKKEREEVGRERQRESVK